MVKMLLTIGLTVLLVLFGMQNSDHVEVSLILGSPRNVRLVFLLAVAASSGFIISHIRSLVREAQLKREIARLTSLCKSAISKIPQTRDREGLDA